VDVIQKGEVKTISQDELIKSGETIKVAPKIFKEDRRINWEWDAEKVYNLIRGLSPYPSAFTEIKTNAGESLYLKIFKAGIKYCQCSGEPGTLATDHKTYLNICCKDACISILELQQAGKKRMRVSDFLAGLDTSVLG